MRLELSNPTCSPCSRNTPPPPQIMKKLYQPFGVLRIKHGCYAHTCFFYYAAPDSVKLHHHSTRSQHRLEVVVHALTGWMKASLCSAFVHPAPVSQHSWNSGGETRHVMKQKHCGRFPIMLSVPLLLPRFQGLVLPLLCPSGDARTVVQPTFLSLACFEAAVFLIWTIHSDFNGPVFVIFLVTVLIYSTGSFW